MNLCPSSCNCGDERETNRDTIRRILRNHTPIFAVSPPLNISSNEVTADFEDAPPERPYLETGRAVGTDWSVDQEEYNSLMEMDYWNLEYSDELETDEGESYYIVRRTG